MRREVRIARPAADVWALVGDPARLHEWFPGFVATAVDGMHRIATTASGLPLPEEILTVDPILRRFQYRLVAPIVQHHLGTVDVFDLGDGTSLVAYATDAEPQAMALVIGGATGAALAELRRILETTPGPGPGTDTPEP